MIDNEKIFLFDMDGTLTPPRKQIETKVVRALRELSKFAKIGVVTGSDYDYIMQQMSAAFDIGGVPVDRVTLLPCNGTKRYDTNPSRNFVLTSEVNMVQELSQDSYNTILRFSSSWQSSIMATYRDLPYTGTFFQYRGSLLNWCPIGREAGEKEREAWVNLDQEHKIREWCSTLLESKMEGCKIQATVALGGSTSLDIYPNGWDKTYALKHFKDSEVYFAGDKCMKGGNDWHIFEALKPSSRSFKVESTAQTVKIIENFIASNS